MGQIWKNVFIKKTQLLNQKTFTLKNSLFQIFSGCQKVSNDDNKSNDNEENDEEAMDCSKNWLRNNLL